MRNAFKGYRQGDLMESHEFYELSEDIERALFIFESTANYTIMRLYRRSDVTDRLSEASEDSVPPVLANGDDETVFLVYLFVSYFRLRIMN
jgi:hypothetical protein